MKHLCLLLAATMLFLTVSGQEDMKLFRETRFSPEMKSYQRAMAAKVPVLKLPDAHRLDLLPVSLDNSQLKYFRGIIDQGQNMTCEQASGVSYLFGYEINRKRDVSAAVAENQYPEKYTYNYMNGGDRDNGVSFFYSWDEIKKQGHPTVDRYPPNDTLGSFGWMSGYDRYLSGMKNRLKQVYSIPVNTEEGILTLKHFLFDHLDGSTAGGIAVFGCSSLFTDNLVYIPAGSPEAGKGILTSFFPLATHGMTLVGYNDSIHVDLNGDGLYTNDLDINGDGRIDPKDWEFGAWRVANSYGSYWEDGGYIWIMYHAMALDYDEGMPGWTSNKGVWNSSVYTLEPAIDYTPLLTVKSLMSHTDKKSLSVRAGIAANPLKQFPEHILEFPIWNHQGGSHPLNEAQPALTAIEAGFDISPLLSYAEPGKPCRLFFIVDDVDELNLESGRVDSVSFISYLNGNNVIPVAETNVPIVNNGSVVFSAVFTPEFDKTTITNAALPPLIAAQPYSVQMQATGGRPPYSWSLLNPFQKTATDSVFPVIDQQQLTPQSDLIPFQKVVLPFTFPFYGKQMDTVYVNAYGFITFTPEQLPYYYLVDQEEMIRSNRIISPLFSLEYFITGPQGKMWYDSGPDWAGFRWSTKMKNNESGSALNFALRLHKDGKIEFLYGDSHNSMQTEKTFSGISAGDDNDFTVWTQQNLESISGKSFLFDPVDLPGIASISQDGLLSLDQAAEEKIYALEIGVRDADNITTTKKFSLASAEMISRIYSVYPNPTKDVAFIENKSGNNQPAKVIIYNMMGKMMLEEKVYGQKTVIHVETFAPGVYLFLIHAGQYSQTEKVIIR